MRHKLWFILAHLGFMKRQSRSRLKLFAIALSAHLFCLGLLDSSKDGDSGQPGIGPLCLRKDIRMTRPCKSFMITAPE